MLQKLVRFVGSRWFFGLVVLLFVMQTAWLALSARFPMAFDESFHVGIIKLYSHQWGPWLMHQPPGPAPYGALTTDPSYLYHYVMSFPYRLFTAWFTNPILVIVMLRLINVAFFAASLVLFRQVLLKAKATPAMVHSTLLFFVLVPVVPLVAAHVNYDNLQILLVALSLLIALKFREQLQRKRQCNAGLLLHTASFCMLASLVKFSFLPIFAAIAGYIVYILWRYVGKPKQLVASFQKNWRSLTRVNKTVALSLFIVSLGLFSQRYAVNVIRYHNPIPQCGQVLGVERCQAYGPWARNYRFAQSKTTSSGNPAIFVGGWLYGMFYRSFFAINGPGGPATYDNKPPLPLLTAAAVAVFGFGIYLVVRFRRAIFHKNPALGCLLFVSLVYVVALMGRNYNDYLHLGQLVAINGRYLVPIILPVMLTIGMAYQRFLPQRKQVLVLGLVFILFLQGGGALSFIYDSNVHWYRSDSQTVVRTNERLHTMVKPFILGWPEKH